MNERTIVRPTKFDNFMMRVNRILIDKVGITADDCEDYKWRDEFDSGATPYAAVMEAFEYWGFDPDEF